ncbi:MAG: sulfotransferase family 2 domain-containing protein [Bauldia sp.]|uniref:sulfotransferase family 2 domain-containing protein n=1 Tax=Bauldia sp. TaxID=2575872 RepID=UPI001E12D363|nr:sulfotransferase family 2 domain-containing protein [Bauldia sp.]MCB1495590.1 sulfotransferase family 2 domain-containing protein [Bauldia sp.]
MILSHKYRFIFLKTAKTGGTSTELALSPVCGPDDILAPLSRPEERKRKDSPARNYALGLGRLGIRLPGEFRHHFPQFYGYYNHMPARQVRRMAGEETWRDYYKFTIERNPWDRQVSFYFWRTRHAKPRPDFRTFMLSPRHRGKAFRSARMKNWWTYTIDDRVAVDRVIRYEDLAGEFDAVCDHLGIGGSVALPGAKGHTRKDIRHYRDFYDDETRALVARWYAREIDTFGYEF